MLYYKESPRPDKAPTNESPADNVERNLGPSLRLYTRRYASAVSDLRLKHHSHGYPRLIRMDLCIIRVTFDVECPFLRGRNIHVSARKDTRIEVRI